MCVSRVTVSFNIIKSTDGKPCGKPVTVSVYTLPFTCYSFSYMPLLYIVDLNITYFFINVSLESKLKKC